MTSSMTGLRSSSKALPKAQLLPPKKSWSVSWSAARLIHYSFLKPSHLGSMLIKSMRCTKNCNACSRHWSIQRVQFFSVTTPDRTSHTQHFKSWMNWVTKFASSTIFTWSLANWLPLLQASQQLFAGKTLPQSVGGRMLSKSSSNP